MRTETLKSMDGYLQEMQAVIAELPRDEMLATVSSLYVAWELNQQVFVLGNGGSASTASHIANDLSKATIVPGMPRLKVISLTDNVALMTAWANDTSYDEVFRQQLENLLEPGDVVLGISASGNSPNVIRAMEFARQHCAVTIGWTGMNGGQLKFVTDLCVRVPTDDVGMIESAHLVLDHLVTRQLYLQIRGEQSARATQLRLETQLEGNALARSPGLAET